MRTLGIALFCALAGVLGVQGTWLFDHHPEWLLGKKESRLLDLGNSAARHWLTEHIDQFLTREGVDLYRQDFNMDPLSYWRGDEAPDRQGFTENLPVQGYLAFWDELRRRDHEGKQRFSGRAPMEAGLPVHLAEPRQAALICYQLTSREHQ